MVSNDTLPVNCQFEAKAPRVGAPISAKIECRAVDLRREVVQRSLMSVPGVSRCLILQTQFFLSFDEELRGSGSRGGDIRRFSAFVEAGSVEDAAIVRKLRSSCHGYEVESFDVKVLKRFPTTPSGGVDAHALQ